MRLILSGSVADQVKDYFFILIVKASIAARISLKNLKAKKCIQSMSDTGNCYDNAITKAFFKTLRAELTYHTRFKNKK